MTKNANQNFWLLSGAFFTFFLTWSFSFSLFPLWLNQTIGLTGEAMGVIFSFNAIAALFVMPCYGYIQDKLGLRKHILYFIAFMLILTGPFYVFVYGPLLQSYFYVGAALGGLFLAVAFNAGIGALESYVDRIARQANFEFGTARMWGSLGWAAATFFSGNVFNYDPNFNFWLATVCAMFFLLFIALVRFNLVSSQQINRSSNRQNLNLKLAVGLLFLPKFWAFIIFVMGVSSVYGVYDQQFAVYFASFFPSREQGNAVYGYLNSLQVFLEAIGLFLAPLLINKIGARNGLILSGVIMATRMIGSGFAEDVISISLMKLLHAAELPILLIAIFKYISATFDARLSATLYIVGFQFSTQIAASGMSIAAGMMYDSLGFANSYQIMGGIVLSFTVISYFLLSSDQHMSNKQTIYQ